MELSARVAAPHDLDPVVQLACEFWAEQRAARGGELWAAREAPQPAADDALHRAAVSARYQAAIDDRNIVVGIIDEVVLGYGRAAIETLGDGVMIGRISELFVDVHAREVSLGDEIINHIVHELRGAGCSGVDAFALPGERLTKNFFEAHGFKARLLTMHHRFE